MIFERKKQKVRYWFYVILLLLCYLLQATPKVLEIDAIKPILIISVAVWIAMGESTLTAAIFGMISGLLWDFCSATVFGFHALVWLLFSAILSVLTQRILKSHWINYMILCFVFVALDGFIQTGFTYFIWQQNNSMEFFLSRVLPSAGYTALLSIIIYFLCRKVSKYFYSF